jgi:hypothetical protein
MFRKENFDIAFFDDREIQFLDRGKFLPIRNVDCRVWASVIANCDYFVGCDSAGQHIARAFDVPGAVFMGGTSEINTSYPDYFTMLKKEGPRTYMSYRLADFDYWLSELNNSDLMSYSTDEMINAGKVLIQEARKSSKGK